MKLKSGHMYRDKSGRVILLVGLDNSARNKGQWAAWQSTWLPEAKFWIEDDESAASQDLVEDLGSFMDVINRVLGNQKAGE